MPHTVNAIVTRERGISGQYADKQVILEMPANQFNDWRALGWVAVATADEVQAHKAAELEAAEQAAAAAAAEAAQAKKPKPATKAG